jgi:membrane protein implicated in regulation of membrane protease activity
MMNKKTLLTGLSLLIFTFFELTVVILDVGLMALAFAIPALIGYLLKPQFGDLVYLLFLAAGIAAVAVVFVYRKQSQAYFRRTMGQRSENLIEKLRFSRCFKDISQ